jgi:hypothetical protein
MCAGGSAPPPSARPPPPKTQSPTPPQNEWPGPGSNIPHAGPPRPPRRPDLQPLDTFFDKRPESIHLDLAQMPVVDQDLGEGLGVSGRRPPPPPDGLHLVAGDLFSGAQTPPAHHHQQGARHFRRGGAPAIHRRAQGGTKGASAVPAHPTGPPTLAAVLDHVGGPTARTGRVLRMGLSIHRAHLRRNLAPMIPPSTTQGSDYPTVICRGKSMTIRVRPGSLTVAVRDSAKGELRWGR